MTALKNLKINECFMYGNEVWVVANPQGFGGDGVRCIRVGKFTGSVTIQPDTLCPMFGTLSTTLQVQKIVLTYAKVISKDESVERKDAS